MTITLLDPTGERRPNLWTWSLVVNAHARDATSAWRFVEWASSKEFLLRSAFEGNVVARSEATQRSRGRREPNESWILLRFARNEMMADGNALRSAAGR